MVSYDYTDSRLSSLEQDRKQMQTRLENLECAMKLLENQVNNTCNIHTKQMNEMGKNLYCLLIGFVILILYINY